MTTGRGTASRPDAVRDATADPGALANLVGRRERLFLAAAACTCAAVVTVGAVTADSAGPRPSEEGAVTLASVIHRIHDARKQALKGSPKACEETYGLFPCSSSLTGSIFLTVTYGYLLLDSLPMGAILVSDRSGLPAPGLSPRISRATCTRPRITVERCIYVQARGPTKPHKADDSDRHQR